MSQSGEDAVSPVVGTVILVAIAFVLSAGGWLLFNRISSGGEVDDAPALGFQTKPNDSAVEVIRAPAGAAELDWFVDLVPRGTCTPLLNGAAFPTAPGTPVQAGDILTCAPGDSLLIASSQDQGNSLLYQTSFS